MKRPIFKNPFPGKQLFVYDLETYPNYFLAEFCDQFGNWVEFEVFNNDDKDRILSDLITFISDKNKILIGFNNLFFDDYVLKYFIWRNLNAITNQSIGAFADAIIHLPKKRPPWYWELWRLPIPWCRSIDCWKIPIDPKQSIQQAGGLKERSAHWQRPKLQNLPIAPGQLIKEDEREGMRLYCRHDVDDTIFQYNGIHEQILMRIELESMYPGTSCVDKHNAGVCQEVFMNLYAQKTNQEVSKVKKLKSKNNHQIRIKDIFDSLDESHIVNRLQQVRLSKLYHDWRSIEGGFESVKTKLNQEITLGNLNITVGAGGLHSVDTPLNVSNDLIEIDVASYYPRNIINNNLYPRHLGVEFLGIEEHLTETRLIAKTAGNKIKSDGLKIVINSAFGKLGDEFSFLCDYQIMLAVTILGQLSLLELVSRLLAYDIEVLSINTDGIMCHVPETKKSTLRSVYHGWQNDTGYILEETDYKRYVRRDVNNYLAVDIHDTIKSKGIFKLIDYDKKIAGNKGKAPIIAKALREHYINGSFIFNTVMDANNVHDFLYFFHAKKDNTGKLWAMYHGAELQQSTLRWYQSTVGEQIDKRKGDRVINVPNSDNAVLTNDIIDYSIPADLDRSHYTQAINDIIITIGD